MGEFVFFNDTATTEIYTLSLHDALPICRGQDACRATTGRVGRRTGLPVDADAMSTRPQLCAQLGTDFHGCSYSGAVHVTPAPPVVEPQVSGPPSNRRSPHVVDNPGGSAPCRPVDSAIRLCTAAAVDNTVRIRMVTRKRPPSPVGTRAAEALE